MEKMQQQLIAFLRGLNSAQRTLLAGGVVLTAVSIALFVHFFGDGDYKTLYSGMNPADAQGLSQRLTAQNISYRLSPDGTSILVRSDEIDKARLEGASQGPLASGRMGFELFDKPNWSGSDFSEKVNYQRALEAELERTIQTMNGVEGVRVHLVLPRESIFTDRERPPKAAVVLKFRGARLTEQVSASVANLVASAWEDLSPQNVTVVTTDGQRPAGHEKSGNSLEGSQELESALAEKIVQTLSPILGNDHVKSSITIEYDTVAQDSTEETYNPAAAAVLTSQISQETVGDLQPSGIPGTASNTPNSQGASASAAVAATTSTTQGMRSESKTYAVSHVLRHLTEPAGRIKRLAAAILVDDAIESKVDGGKTQEVRRKRTPDEMRQITEIAKAAMGFDEKRGDLFSVQNISFSEPTPEVLPTPNKFQRIVMFTERNSGLIRYVAGYTAVLVAIFAAIYLLILLPIKSKLAAVLRLQDKDGSTRVLPNAGEQAALPSGNELELSPAAALRRQLAASAKQDSEFTSRLIQSWLNEAEATK
jgi:flagellar M-ring protein FliF